MLMVVLAMVMLVVVMLAVIMLAVVVLVMIVFAVVVLAMVVGMTITICVPPRCRSTAAGSTYRTAALLASSACAFAIQQTSAVPISRSAIRFNGKSDATHHSGFARGLCAGAIGSQRALHGLLLLLVCAEFGLDCAAMDAIGVKTTLDLLCELHPACCALLVLKVELKVDIECRNEFGGCQGPHVNVVALAYARQTLNVLLDVLNRDVTRHGLEQGLGSVLDQGNG